MSFRNITENRNDSSGRLKIIEINLWSFWEQQNWLVHVRNTIQKNLNGSRELNSVRSSAAWGNIDRASDGTKPSGVILETSTPERRPFLDNRLLGILRFSRWRQQILYENSYQGTICLHQGSITNKINQKIRFR